MCKKLRYGLLTLLAFMGLTLSAQTTFDFDEDYATIFPDLSFDSDGNGYITEDAVSITKDGFTITVSKGDNPDKNANCIWNKSPRLRIYSGTITISGSGIETIKFIHSGNFTLTTSTGELVGNVWTGNANSVVFTCGENSTQLKQIIINSVIIPIEPVEVSIAQFLDEEDSEDVWYQLTGTVKNLTNKSKGYFDLEDATGSNSVYVYGLASERGGGLGRFGELNIAENDILTIIGNRYTFTNSNGESKNEVTNAYFVSVEKSTVTPKTEDDLNHGTETNPISVAEAVEAAKVIGRDNDTDVSKEEFYVTGTITKINTNKAGTVTYTYSTGTATYFLGDDSGNSFEIFKGKYFEGYDCTGDDDFPDIAIGKEVVVRGKIQYFQSKQPEFVSGSILVLLDDWKPDALPDPVTYEVSVSEALAIAGELADSKPTYDYYEVTGYVVDTPNYYNGTDNAFIGCVDFSIADTKGGEPTLFIYHAWGPNDEKFTEDELDLFAEGDKVVFRGKLQKYIDSDDNVVLEMKNGYLVQVLNVVAVNVPSSGYATLCPPHPILIEDQEVFIVKQVSGSKAILQQLESGTVVPSGVGLLIKGNGMVEFNIADEAGTAPEGNLLVGALKDKELSDSEAFILVGGKFYLCYAGTFPGGKAYLPATVISSSAKIIVFGDETTGINEMNAQDSTNEIYTIGGIRVKNAQQKGIYIINGKKVVK